MSRDQAQQVITAFDGPLSRHFHRDELMVARGHLRHAEYAMERAGKELQEIDAQRPELEASLADARATLAERTGLERERHEIGRLLQNELNARGVEVGVDPPDYLVEHIGTRPGPGAGADLWDDAAARIEQHRVAFDLTDPDELFGYAPPWDRDAFAASHREAEKALECLQRALGIELEIEPPGLELDIGW